MERPPATTPKSEFLEPARIVKYFDLKPGDHVADFGAGHGYFAIPMARIVGGDGKVYAIDIQKPVLDIIRTKARMEHLLNIELIWADLERVNGSHIKDKYLDFALIANTFFQSVHKDVLLREVYRTLCLGGRLAVIEWDETPTPFGPPLTLRVKKETLKQMVAQTGLEIEREFEAGTHHYGLLFKKT